MVEGGILYKGVCDVYVVCSPPPSSPRRGRDRAGCGRGEYAMYTILIVPLVVREAGGLSKLSSSDRIQFHGLTWVPTKEHRMFKLQ